MEQQEKNNYIGQEIKPIPAPEKQIGIDVNNQIYDNLIGQGVTGAVDLSQIESFTRVSQSRDQIYTLLDNMASDPTMSAVLETYAEDATEYASNGHIVWAESINPRISDYVNYLLNAMKVDKNIFTWAHSLCKYGDVYLRLFRKSNYLPDLPSISKKTNYKEESQLDLAEKKLLEQIRVVAYKESDPYVNYLEMMDNPAEMFELTKFGKTAAYIKAEVTPLSMSQTGLGAGAAANFYQYKFKEKNIDIYGATDFVHASLMSSTNRVPEEVQIFMGDDMSNDKDAYTYKVRKGVSLLYNTFKIWREVALLENSILLNRITKSSIVRILGVEVGDMPKEQVGPHLLAVKQLMEQKVNLETGGGIGEYTNPGPIENNVYCPTRNGIGSISTQQIGGEVNVGQLTDLGYFQDKLFGSLRVPKQFFGVTDDNAGFSGGQSLAIISSRYAKMVKRIQNCLSQMLTDAVNLILIDRGVSSYIGQFTIKFNAPVTQEDLDRRDNTEAKVRLVGDIMGILSDISDVEARLNILRALLGEFINNPEVLEILESAIEKEEGANEKLIDSEGTELGLDTDDDLAFNSLSNSEQAAGEDLGLNLLNQEVDDTSDILPSPEELDNLDFTNNEDFE